MFWKKITTDSWQIIQQVIKKQREIDKEMKRKEEEFKEKWNQWGTIRHKQKHK